MTKDNLLSNVLSLWGPEYEIEIQIKFGGWSSSWNWESIFHFTTDLNNNCCNIGQRIPAIWTASLDKVVVSTNVDSNGDTVKEIGDFEEGKWYSFVLSQKKEVKLFLFFILIFFI